MKQVAIGRFLQGACNTPGPGFHILTKRLWKVALENDVRDGEPPTGSQHPVCLAQYLALVCREVDDTVGDHHVHALGVEDALPRFEFCQSSRIAATERRQRG